MNPNPPKNKFVPDVLQRFALGGMVLLTLLTFVAANLHTLLWQSSSWLVSTVLPAVVVDLTNDERAALAEAPLRRNATLDEAARLKAEHMAAHEYFAHYAPDGTSPWYWFDKTGYVYAHAGENLAIHFTDSAEVVEAWMDSPKHRENIVSGKFTEIGVGTAKGEFEGYETVYVVQLFGTPAGAPVAPPPPPPVPAPVATLPVETTAPAEVVEATVLAAAPVEEDIASSVPAAAEEVPVVEATAEPAEVDSVFIETTLIATSSGLAVANVFQDPPARTKSPFLGIATRPNQLLQVVYGALAISVIGLLIASVVVEARRHRFVQVVYGLALILVMGGLWFVHSLLTAGAVIV